MKTKSYTSADIKRAIELYKSGAPIKAITAEIGCNKNTVGDWINGAGVEKRHKRKKPLGDGNHQSG